MHFTQSAIRFEENNMTNDKQDSRGSKDLLNLFLDNYPSKSRFAESFRTLRTNIQFSFMEKDFRSLLVTSTGQAEGKTSAVANLAYTMAKTGKTVLMIDADMRKPFLSRLATSTDSPGLSGLITRVLGTDIKEGSLSAFGVSDLFRLITLQKKTGILYIEERAEQVEFQFLQGELKDINWITRPDEKKLAALLVSNELLGKDDMKKAISRHKATGQKLGYVLINMGLFNEEELKGFLNVHMMDGLRTALQFRTGEFSFRDLEISDFDLSSFDPIDFHQLYDKIVIGEEELPYLKKEILSAVMRTSVDNLFLLPSGSLPPNPSELLGSERISFLLSHFRKRFDLVIIDTPPILPASDALLLAPQVDGVVFMTKAGSMNRDLVAKAVDQLRHAKANILGVVLNQVDVKRDGYYKYYDKYYSKYYGENA